MWLTRLAVLGTLCAASCTTFNTSPVLTAEDFRLYPTVPYRQVLTRLNWRPDLDADLASWCNRTRTPNVHVINGIPVVAPEVQPGNVARIRALANNRAILQGIWGEDVGRVTFLKPDDADEKYPNLCPCACGLVELETRR